MMYVFDLSRLVYRRISQTFAGFLPQYFPWGCVIEEQNIRKRVHVGTFTYNLYMMCICHAHTAGIYRKMDSKHNISKTIPRNDDLNKS